MKVIAKPDISFSCFVFFSPTVFTDVEISSDQFATVSVGMVNLLTAPHLTHMIGKTEDMEYHVKYKFSMEFCSKSPKFCFLQQISRINDVFYGCFFSQQFLQMLESVQICLKLFLLG